MATNRTRIVWLAGVGIVVILTLLLAGSYPAPWPKVLEGMLYVLSLMMLFCYAQLQQLLSALSRPQRIALVCITVVLVLAQLRDRPGDSWPFIPWNMYRGQFEDPQYLEVLGITPDGKELEIPVSEVYQSQSRTTLWRLQVLSSWMETNDCEEKRLRRCQQFRTLLLTTVARFQDQHPEIHVQSVCVNRCTLPRPGPGRKLEISRRKYLQYSIQ